MALYRNLGAITFQCQTQWFQIFSACSSTLILQFKNYQEVNLEQISELLAVYQLILKQDELLEIYSQKNKPSSILVHRAVRVSFQKITIQLLCRIIKEMITSIFHSKKVVPGKVGQINRQMFFQIDGELRYLYFPVRRNTDKTQVQVSQVLQFFNQLKDQRQVSHRLLLKKISKCNSLQEIIDQTEYFMSIYHAKQTQTSASFANLGAKQVFPVKKLNRTKCSAKLTYQNSANQFYNSAISGLNNDPNNMKNTARRKYHLFKNAEPNNSRNTFVQNNNFFSNTCRKPQRQSSLQNSTYRTNSRAMHVDMSHKLVKNQSGSLFNRASSVYQSPNKLSGSRKNSSGMSLHNQSRNNASQSGQSMSITQNRQFSRKKQLNTTYQSKQIDTISQSVLSKNINQSHCEPRSPVGREGIHNSQSSQSQYSQSQSSQSMKQMVQNSLQKWKNKSTQKANLFNKIKQKDILSSTQVDSRSKFLQRYQKPSQNASQQPQISQIPEARNTHDNTITIENTKATTIKNTNASTVKNNDVSTVKNNNATNVINANAQVQSLHPVKSQRKLKKTVHANRSSVVDSQKNLKTQKLDLEQRNQQQIQIFQCSNFIKKQNKQAAQYFQQSLQETNLCQSSIQNLALKSKNKQNNQVRKVERNRTSIKQAKLCNEKIQKNISGQSQAQKMQYSRSSRNKIGASKSENKQNNPVEEAETKALLAMLTQICHQKKQIDCIGVAVVKTTEHLKNFQSIFWQLPMFFLYKKFYQKRLKLHQNAISLISKICSTSEKSKASQQIESQTSKYMQQIRGQNVSIQQSLKKLLKTVKKKIKRQYDSKAEQDYIQKHLHLDYTVSYDNIVDEFTSIYLNSLLEAKSQFPELLFHIVDILQAILVCKGKTVQVQYRGKLQSQKQMSTKIQIAEAYFNRLVKIKQVRAIVQSGQSRCKNKI